MTRQDKLELLEVRSLQKRTNYNKNQSKKERTIIKCQQVEGQGLGDLNIYIYIYIYILDFIAGHLHSI